MAPSAYDWIEWLRMRLVRSGLPLEEAEDCTTEILLRYQRRKGCYPWEQLDADKRLLVSLVCDKACEYYRKQVRRTRAERAYLMRQSPHLSNPSPEEEAIGRVLVKQFTAYLPPHLRGVLELRLEGLNTTEIARELGISVGAVCRYLSDLRQYWLRFLGPNPIERVDNSGIIGSDAEQGIAEMLTGGWNDETIAKALDDTVADGGDDLTFRTDGSHPPKQGGGGSDLDTPCCGKVSISPLSNSNNIWCCSMGGSCFRGKCRSERSLIECLECVNRCCGASACRHDQGWRISCEKCGHTECRNKFPQPLPTPIPN